MNATAAAGTTMGKDEFLKLFTSQLKYQDPLKPMDSTQFTTQLAQFSSLEQLYNVSASMQQVSLLQQQANNASAAGLIGRNITATDGITGKAVSVSVSNGVTSILLDNGSRVAFANIQQIF
ncbi:MAG: flagellar hook capping FlgD N-terminal domain-containing protein [Thermodesulfovibrionales bacterium]